MFLNAIMLAGVAGAALPLIVHLLSRARVRTVDWGAMMFLEEGKGTQEQAARLKQWTLLLLRMATVALIAIAMARPIAVGSWAGPQGPVTAAIVVDVSASMAQPTDDGRTRADAAREAVLRILSNLRKGDRAALIVAGSGTRGGGGAAAQPSADLQAVAARAAELKPGPGAADIAIALNDAAAVLERHGGANAHLYVVTDTQASNWQGVDESFRSAWRARTTRAGRALPVDVVVVGDRRAAENVAVESITLVSPPAIASLACEIEVSVRNFGVAPRPQLPLVVRTSKGEPFNGTIDLPADAATTVTVPLRFDAPGQQVVTAQVASGTMASDDRLQHVIDVVAPVRVLIVSGDERDGRFRSESDFLRTALNPFAAMKRPGVDPTTVAVLPVEKWVDARIADTDVLVLANVPELTPQQVRSVETFVYAGGGLLMAPGGMSRPESYNRALFRDGAGLLPASLAGPSSDNPTSLLGIELSHPIFRFLRGRPDPIPSAVVARMFTATPRSGAVVLASYVTGHPFLIEGAYGRGRVLLMTTTIDADWNTLPLSSFYLPFAQSSVRHLAAAAMAQRNLTPGQEVRARFSDLPDGGRATLTTPLGIRVALQVNGYDGNYEAATTDTAAPGVYVLRRIVGGPERVERYVVRPPAAESDLKPLAEVEWSRLQRSLGFRRANPAARPLLPASAAGGEGRELWLPVLLGAIALVAVELMLTRFWSEGR